MLLHRVESVVEEHIRVERVILGSCLLFGHRVIKRYRDLSLVGEEFSELKVRGHAIRLVVVLRSLSHTVFESAESFGDIFSLHVNATHIRELHVEVALCRPSTGVVVFLQSELIHPDFS